MNKEDIEKAVYMVNKGLNDRNSLNDKKQELEILLKEPKVIEYLNLLKEIDKIESDIESYRNIYGKIDDSLDKRIVSEFRVCCSSDKCQHDFWFYVDSCYNESVYLGRMCWNKEHYEFSESIDTPKLKFLYNRYRCLECRKEIEVVDWKEFEEENFVFKKYGLLNFLYYRNEYFKFLYHGYDISEIEEFLTEMFLEKDKGQVLGRRKVRTKLTDK